MQPEISIIEALISYGSDELWGEFSDAVSKVGGRFSPYTKNRRYMLLAYLTGCHGPMGYDVEVDSVGLPRLVEWEALKIINAEPPPNFFGTALQDIADSIVRRLKLLLLKKLQNGELIALAEHEGQRGVIPRSEWSYLQFKLETNGAGRPDQDIHYYRLDIRERRQVLSDVLSKEKFKGPNRRGAKNRTAPYVDAFFAGVKANKWPPTYSKAVGRQLLELELPETIGKKRPSVDSLRKAVHDDDRYSGLKR